MSELCVKLRISDEAARAMLKAGTLVGIRTARKGKLGGDWRIVDPGHRFEAYLRSLEEHLLHIPLLSAHETAQIIGTSYDYLHHIVLNGKIKPMATEGKRRLHLYSVAEIRRYLWERQKIARPKKKTVLLARLVEWGRQILEQQNQENASGGYVKDEMDELATQILKLPEPARSQSLRELFLKMDKARCVIQATQRDQYRTGDTPETDHSPSPGLPATDQPR